MTGVSLCRNNFVTLQKEKQHNQITPLMFVGEYLSSGTNLTIVSYDGPLIFRFRQNSRHFWKAQDLLFKKRIAQSLRNPRYNNT